MRPRFPFLLFLLCTALSVSGFCSDTVDVTWRIRSRGDWDSLIINGVKITSEVATDPDFPRFVKSLEAAGLHFDNQGIRVTIPVGDGFFTFLHPKLPGNLRQVISVVTSPDRQVTYFYKGRELHRYLIRCSSKGTGNNPTDANYWLDGELLGNWNKACDRFMAVQWQKNAVIDIIFDRPHPFTESGSGLYLLPEFEQLAWKHQMIINEHSTFRKVGDD